MTEKFTDQDNIIKNLSFRFNKSISKIFGDSSFVNNETKLNKNYISSKDLIPTWVYDDNNECFLNEKSIGFILEGNPITGANQKTINTINNYIRDSLPRGAYLQCTNLASPIIDKLLDNWKKNKKEEGGYKTYCQKTIDYVKNSNWYSQFDDEPFIVRDFRIIFSVSIIIEKDKSDETITEKIANIKNHLLKKKEDSNLSKYQKKCEILKKSKKALMSSLKSIGIATYEYKDLDLIKLLDQVINPNITNEKRREQSYRTDASIQDQVSTVRNIINVKQDHLSFFADDKKKEVLVKSFNILKYPQYLALWNTSNLIGDFSSRQNQIECPFISTYIVYKSEDFSKKSSGFTLKTAKSMKDAENPINKLFPEAKEKARDYQFIGQKIREGNEIVESYYQITVFSPPEKLEAVSEVVKNIYSNNGGFTLIEEKFIQLQSFMSLIPFNVSEGLFLDLKKFERVDTTLTWSCANLLPIIAEPICHWHSPNVMLFGRRGQPLFWDPFTVKSGNFNTIIVGRSGAGKSFFMQWLLTSMLGMGANAYIIDNGRSFESPCKIQGGKFIEFKENSDIRLNPFSLLKGVKEDRQYDENKALEILDNMNEEEDLQMSNFSEIIIFINAIIRLMCRPDSKMDEIEEAFIAVAIDEAYDRKKHEADVTLVRDILLKNKDQRAKDLGLILRKYTREGTYGKFFDGKANLSLDMNYMVFEFEALDNKEDLMKVAVQYVIFIIYQKIYLGNRKNRSCFIIDEAWKFLKGHETGKFLEGVARKFRKLNANLTCATQSYMDFYTTDATRAVISNSNWKCLLGQDDDVIERAVAEKKLNITENEKKDIKSLETVNGKFSEVMIMGDFGNHLARLIVDPYMMYLFSTDQKDTNIIKELIKNGLTISDALNQLAYGNKEISNKEVNDILIKNISKLKNIVRENVTGHCHESDISKAIINYLSNKRDEKES